MKASIIVLTVTLAVAIATIVTEHQVACLATIITGSFGALVVFPEDW